MVLVDRYVEAVRKQLPRAQRDDIAAELRETLLSQIEDLQTNHGHPPTEDEVAAILQRYGAPDVVAARYGARNHLIGPAVYPHYRFVVRLMLWIFGVVMLIALAMTAWTAASPVPALLRVVWTGALVMIANLTIVTIVFARIERMKHDTRRRADWDPRDLLAVAPAVRTSISRSEAVAGMLNTIVWLLLWTGVLPINQWLLWNRLPLEPAPIWDALTPLIVSLMAANILVCAIAVVRPRWVHFYDLAGVLLDFGIGVVVFEALRRPDLILLTDPTSPAASLAALFNVFLKAGLIAWGLLVIASIAANARRLIAVRRRALPT